MAKRARKPNFTAGEIVDLLNDMYTNRDMLLCALRNGVTNANKNDKWEEIALSISINHGVAQRSADDIRDKWKSLKSDAIRRVNDQKRTGGGIAATPTKYEEMVFAVLGDNQALIHGEKCTVPDVFAAAVSGTNRTQHNNNDNADNADTRNNHCQETITSRDACLLNAATWNHPSAITPRKDSSLMSIQVPKASKGRVAVTPATARMSDVLSIQVPIQASKGRVAVTPATARLSDVFFQPTPQNTFPEGVETAIVQYPEVPVIELQCTAMDESVTMMAEDIHPVNVTVEDIHPVNVTVEDVADRRPPRVTPAAKLTTKQKHVKKGQQEQDAYIAYLKQAAAKDAVKERVLKLNEELLKIKISKEQ